jgi:hypothetical protein
MLRQDVQAADVRLQTGGGELLPARHRLLQRQLPPRQVPRGVSSARALVRLRRRAAARHAACLRSTMSAARQREPERQQLIQ